MSLSERSEVSPPRIGDHRQIPEGQECARLRMPQNDSAEMCGLVDWRSSEAELPCTRMTC